EEGMPGRVFPKTVDNVYRGQWPGLALFVLVVLMKGLQGALSVADTHDTAINADGIPLDTYGAAAAHEVLNMFALLGMYNLVVPVIAVIVLVRWRALVSFVFLLLIAVQLGARAINMAYSGWQFSLTGQPVGFYVNLGILGATVIGFLLSLMDRRRTA